MKNGSYRKSCGARFADNAFLTWKTRNSDVTGFTARSDRSLQITTRTS